MFQKDFYFIFTNLGNKKGGNLKMVYQDRNRTIKISPKFVCAISGLITTVSVSITGLITLF